MLPIGARTTIWYAVVACEMIAAGQSDPSTAARRAAMASSSAGIRTTRVSTLLARSSSAVISPPAQCSVYHLPAVVAPYPSADYPWPVAVIDSNAAYFDYDARCADSVGSIAVVYDVLAADGWHGITPGETQSDGVPRAGLGASLGSICSCALYVKGCADVLSAPSVTSSVVG